MPSLGLASSTGILYACLDDRTIAPAWQIRAAREWLNVEPFVLPGGHCPNVSRPEALAKLLDEVAG